jgi:hypothetical protein
MIPSRPGGAGKAPLRFPRLESCRARSGLPLSCRMQISLLARYLAKKEELLSRKKAVQEEAERRQAGAERAWLEPFREWLQTAKTLDEIVETGSAIDKKRVAVEIFGSNLFIDSKKARGDALNPWPLLLEKSRYGGMVAGPGIEPGTQGFSVLCSTN